MKSRYRFLLAVSLAVPEIGAADDGGPAHRVTTRVGDAVYFQATDDAGPQLWALQVDAEAVRGTAPRRGGRGPFLRAADRSY